jgi:hypothetical protein
LKFRTFWLLCGAAFVALVIFLSLTPHPIDAGRIEEVKVGHFIAYAWLMLWYAQIYSALRTRIGIAVGLMAMGIVLEFVQGLTGYRTFAYSDMRDNALGILIGFGVALTVVGKALRSLEGSYLRVKRA